VLDEVEERLLAPVHVVEDADEGRMGRDRLDQLAKRPGDLLARGGHLPVSGHRLDRFRDVRLARDFGKLLDDLDDRPIRDALAVGQAPTATTSASPSEPRISAARRDLPTPAAPRSVNR
jgi:hypothetical protein